MRSASTIFFCFCLLAAPWACGPIDQTGASAPATSSDGGTASGGTSDGGAGSAVGGQGSSGQGGSGGSGAPATSGCEGVMPTSVPPPVTVTNPHGGGDVCWNATADLAGDIAAESHPASMGAAWRGTWQVWSKTGASIGRFGDVGGDVVGEPNGFAATNRDDHVVYSPAGQETKRSKLTGNCTAEAFFSMTGGSVVLERCGGDLKAYRFDAKGNQTARASVGPAATSAAIVDAQDRTLVVAGGAPGFGARWFDAGLKPASDVFGIPGGGGTAVIVRPLIGGGAAVQIDGRWVATVQSGKGDADAAPGWLAGHRNYDLQIIRGAMAYAFIPRQGASPHNALDLFSGTGERCGTQSFPADGLSMGPDGTVIGSSGPGGCSHPFWSALLR